MKSFLLADRYARSVSSLVESDAEAEAIAINLTEIARVYDDSAELRSALANPALHESRRLAILDAVLTRCGAPELLRNLGATMLRRRRIDLLPAVADLVARKTDERLNRVEVDVTSALPLTPTQVEQLTQTLQTYTGKNIRIEFAIDPALLGGVTARIQDVILDGSLRSRVARLQRFLLPEENLGG